jgi:hypothetical protein
LVAICKVLVEEAHSLIDFEKEALELLELLRIRSVGSHAGYLLACIENSLKFWLEILPERVAYNLCK